jgi:hypothetical protein
VTLSRLISGRVRWVEGDRCALYPLRCTRLGFSPPGPQPNTALIEEFALRQVYRVVAYRLRVVFGDGEIGRESPGGGAHFSCFPEQPGKRQRGGQSELGESPIRVDFDRFAQAAQRVNHTSEIDVGETHEQVPSEKERIARTEPHRVLDVGAGVARPTEEKLHQPEIGVCYGELAVQADGELELETAGLTQVASPAAKRRPER